MSAIENQSAIPSWGQAVSRRVPVWPSHFGPGSQIHRRLAVLLLLGGLLSLGTPFRTAHADAAADYCARFNPVKSWQGTYKLTGSGVYNKTFLSESFVLNEVNSAPCPADRVFEGVLLGGMVSLDDKAIVPCFPAGQEIDTWHLGRQATKVNPNFPFLSMQFSSGTYIFGKSPTNIGQSTYAPCGGDIVTVPLSAAVMGPHIQGPLAFGGIFGMPLPSEEDIRKNIWLKGDPAPFVAPSILGAKSGDPSTWKVTWNFVPKEEIIDDPCKEHNASVIGCENQSLGESVKVVGTPFALHYQSDRAAGRAFTNPTALAHAREFGGWTLSAHHRYDPTTNALYLGSGSRRDFTKLGSVIPSAAGGFLAGSADAGAVYEFAADGRHLKTLHALTGAVLYTFSYDAQKRLAGVTDGNGNLTTIQRDLGGLPTAIIGPYGQTTALTVDSNNYLASITNPAGEVVKLQSTAKGLLTRYTTPKGFVSQFAWDGSGRLLRDTDAAGGFHALTRTEAGTAFTVNRSTAEGRTYQYQVTPATAGGEARVITDAAGLKSTTTRTASGGVAADSPDGMKTTTTLGADPRFGRSAAFTKSSRDATPGGLALVTTGARAATLTNPTNPFSLITQTDTAKINGRSYTSTYASLNRTTTTKTPAGRVSQTIVDEQGRVVNEKTAGLLPTACTYDTRGRLASVMVGSGAGARTANFSYDTAGYLGQLTDPLGHTVSYQRDAAGRVLKQTLADGKAIGYAYDANGNLTAITPPGRTAHRFAYTNVDLPSAYVPPKAGIVANPTRTTYNLDRQLVGIKRPDGKTVTMAYDAAGRAKTITTARGAITYAYHATTGQLNAISAPDGIDLTYDYDGQLLTNATWAGPVTGSVQRAYDNDFRVKELMLNGTNAISFSYDPDSLPAGAGDLALTRNPQNGLLTGSTLDQVDDFWTYNGFAEPVSYRVDFQGTALYTVSYSYDRLGRITVKTETTGGETHKYAYRYDLAGRLVKVFKDGVLSSTYAYDLNDNRLSLTRPSGQVTGVYDAQDRLLSYGTAAYAYTANGDLKSKKAGTQTTLYNYDALGNLLGVTLPNGTKIGYLTDGQNRRIGKQLNGVRVQGFLYQGPLQPIAELDALNNVVSRFVYATGVNVPDYLVKGGETYRLITDQLGSPRLVVKTIDGSVVQRMDYDEFGNVTLDTNPGFQPFGFAGGLYDRDTRLVRFGARDYEAETGRWTMKDPILFEGEDTNLYEYVRSDPINFIDPIGLQSLQKGLIEFDEEKFAKECAKKVAKETLKKALNEKKKVKNPHPIKEYENALKISKEGEKGVEKQGNQYNRTADTISEGMRGD